MDVIPFVSVMKEIEFVLKASRRYLDGTVKYFQKPIRSLQRQSRGNHTHSLSTNTTSYEAHCYQISSLLEFVANSDVDIKHVDTK